MNAVFSLLLFASCASAGALKELNTAAGDGVRVDIPAVRTYAELWGYAPSVEGDSGAIGGNGLPTVTLQLVTNDSAATAGAGFVVYRGTIKIPGEKTINARLVAQQGALRITTDTGSMLISAGLTRITLNISGAQEEYLPVVQSGNTVRLKGSNGLGNLALTTINKEKGLFALSGSGSAAEYQAMSLLMMTYLYEQLSK